MAKVLMVKVCSFLPSRLSQLSRIRRGLTFEVALHVMWGDRVGDAGKAFHHVVAMKIVAAKTAEPAGLTYERRMRNVERVVLHLELAMTVPAVSGLHRDAAARVLAMTARASLGCDLLASVGKARLVETIDGVPIERPFVTCLAIAVFYGSESEVDRRFAESEEKTRAGLDLLAHATGRRSMAARAVELAMSYVHFSRSCEVLLAWCEQTAQDRIGQTDAYAYSHPSPHARSRGGPALRLRAPCLRRHGDCRETVILAIVGAVGRHGYRVD
jgi:hypothetical protein